MHLQREGELWQNLKGYEVQIKNKYSVSYLDYSMVFPEEPCDTSRHNHILQQWGSWYVFVNHLCSLPAFHSSTSSLSSLFSSLKIHPLNSFPLISWKRSCFCCVHRTEGGWNQAEAVCLLPSLFWFYSTRHARKFLPFPSFGRWTRI